MAPFNHQGPAFLFGDSTTPPSKRGREQLQPEGFHGRARDSLSRRAVPARSDVFSRQTLSSSFDSDTNGKVSVHGSATENNGRTAITPTTKVAAFNRRSLGEKLRNLKRQAVNSDGETSSIDEAGSEHENEDETSTVVSQPIPPPSTISKTATSQPSVSQPAISKSAVSKLLVAPVSSVITQPAASATISPATQTPTISLPPIVVTPTSEGIPSLSFSAAPIPTITTPSVIAESETLSTTSAPDKHLPNKSTDLYDYEESGEPSAISYHQSLSSGAEHGLIALGAIAVLIILGFLVFLFLKLRKIDSVNNALRFRHQRRAEKNGLASRSIFPSNQLSSEKSPVSEWGFPAFFNPIRRADSPSTRAFPQPSSQQQGLIRNSLLHNAAPMARTPAPPYTALNSNPVNVPVPPATYQSAPLNPEYRASELSSLSSGFGDAIIDVPESGPRPPIERKPVPSLAPLQLGVPRFSWANIPTPHTLGEHRQRQRETMTTTASRESTPRFRTVRSWVDHQSSRLLRAQDSVAGSERGEETAPKMPEIPAEFARDRRRESGETDAAFRVHPGEEVRISKGSRIPSAVLTRKLRL